MPSDEMAVPVPTYPAALRLLVGRAFGPPRAVPASPLPGGALQDRLLVSPATEDPLVASSGLLPATAGTSIVEPVEYWERALPHRLLVHGPLSDIAGLDVEEDERRAIERRMLAVYYQRYNALPLPHDLLTILAKHESDRPDDRVAEWLEQARELIMPAPSPGEARRRRLRLRAEAIRRCADGRWSEEATGVAELLVDVIALCHAARLDLEYAISAPVTTEDPSPAP